MIEMIQATFAHLHLVPVIGSDALLGPRGDALRNGTHCTVSSTCPGLSFRTGALNKAMRRATFLPPLPLAQEP